MLNKFMVAGRLTADPEIKTVGDNRLCKFTIACERPKRKGRRRHRQTSSTAPHGIATLMW